MKLLTLKFFVLLVVLFIPNIVNSKELNGLKNLVIYEDQKKISEISFKNEKDKDVSLSEYENKLLILNFWATWCEPCKEEMPSLQNLQNNSKFKISKSFFRSNLILRFSSMVRSSLRELFCFIKICSFSQLFFFNFPNLIIVPLSSCNRVEIIIKRLVFPDPFSPFIMFNPGHKNSMLRLEKIVFNPLVKDISFKIILFCNPVFM